MTSLGHDTAVSSLLPLLFFLLSLSALHHHLVQTISNSVMNKNMHASHIGWSLPLHSVALDGRFFGSGVGALRLLCMGVVRGGRALHLAFLSCGTSLLLSTPFMFAVVTSEGVFVMHYCSARVLPAMPPLFSLQMGGSYSCWDKSKSLQEPTPLTPSMPTPPPSTTFFCTLPQRHDMTRQATC